MACHNYQSAHQKYPPGATSTPGGAGVWEFGESWTIQILGYIEQQNLLDAYKGTFGSPMVDRLSALSEQKIEMFICASATQEDELTTEPAIFGSGSFTTHYYGSMAPTDVARDNPASYYKHTVGGSPDFFKIGLTGVFSPRSGDPTNPMGSGLFSSKIRKNFCGYP